MQLRPMDFTFEQSCIALSQQFVAKPAWRNQTGLIND
jgi:hypothetical protein